MTASSRLSAIERATLLDRLGLPADADRDAVRCAYRRLAMQMHPDHDADPAATARFLAVDDAYRRLLDEDREEVQEGAVPKPPESPVVADPPVSLADSPTAYFRAAYSSAQVVAGPLRRTRPASGRDG